MIIGEDKERKIILLESEINDIIECLDREPHNIFLFLEHQNIIDKLKKLPREDSDDICPHCGFPKSLRNPSGKCDHLYYPENCKICASLEKGKKYAK